MYHYSYITSAGVISKGALSTSYSWKRIREQEKWSEKFGEHSTSMKQINESYKEFVNNCR